MVRGECVDTILTDFLPIEASGGESIDVVRCLARFLGIVDGGIITSFESLVGFANSQNWVSPGVCPAISEVCDWLRRKLALNPNPWDLSRVRV
jgi:hypothetical protein